MTFDLWPTNLTPDKQITLRLTLSIAALAVLTFAGRRGWLRPKELLWVGGAMIFAIAPWLFGSVVPVVRARYPALPQAVPISLALVAPVVIAMGFGLWFVYRRLTNPLVPVPKKTQR